MSQIMYKYIEAENIFGRPIFFYNSLTVYISLSATLHLNAIWFCPYVLFLSKVHFYLWYVILDFVLYLIKKKIYHHFYNILWPGSKMTLYKV